MRPAIAGNVMQHQQQHVLAAVQRKQMRTQRRLARKIKAMPRRAGERIRQASLGHRHDRKPRPASEASRISCRGHPERLGKDRAQALVPRDQVAKRGLQRGHSRARPSDAAPSGSCRSRSALPGDRGTTAGAAQTTAGSPPVAQQNAGQDAPPGRRHPDRLARASTVGASNRAADRNLDIQASHGCG